MTTVHKNECQPGDTYHRYEGELSPQPSYVSLNCETGELVATYEAGGEINSHYFHRRAHRWDVPLVLSAETNELLDAIQPLAQRVLDGYDTEWDGHNIVGTFDEDATQALSEIDDLVGELDTSRGTGVVSPEYWFGDDPDESVLPGSMSDEELEVYVEEQIAGIISYTAADLDPIEYCDYVEFYSYLENIRDARREA